MNMDIFTALEKLNLTNSLKKETIDCKMTVNVWGNTKNIEELCTLLGKFL